MSVNKLWTFTKYQPVYEVIWISLIINENPGTFIPNLSRCDVMHESVLMHLPSTGYSMVMCFTVVSQQWCLQNRSGQTTHKLCYWWAIVSVKVCLHVTDFSPFNAAPFNGPFYY